MSTEDLVPVGAQLAEGKTRTIFEHPDHPSLVIHHYKDKITRFDNPDLTEEFAGKGMWSNTVNAVVMELLKAAGLPVAFEKLLSPLQFSSMKLNMIKLEVVARRFGVGSMLKRRPDLKTDGEIPHIFPRLVIEFFLKTTAGSLKIGEKTLVDGLKPEHGEDDPYIAHPLNNIWDLAHPKKPAWMDTFMLGKTVHPHEVLFCEHGMHVDIMKKIENITRQTFLVLEGFWKTFGMRLVDFKIELGIDAKGNVYIGDVIDPDSWRLRTFDWKEMSKENFRQGMDMSKVAEKYFILAELVKQFRNPEQALVLWRGSTSDQLPEHDDYKVPGIHFEDIVLSGHKQTEACMKKLRELEAKYPEGAAILALVGRSNGLGPILAAQTHLPVIAVPMTMGDFPQDAFSSLRMPSDVPLTTAWDMKNGLQAALRILALKNPYLYAKLRGKYEDRIA